MKTTKYKVFVFSLVGYLLLLSPNMFSQDIGANKNPSEFMTNPLIWMFLGGLLLLILISLFYLLYAVLELKTIIERGLNPNARASSVFDLTKAVPIELEHEIMLDHDYDGIRELDNNLPPWWVYLFYGTIAFSIFYIWFYHFNGTGKLQEDEYKMELVEAEELAKLQANKVDENSVELLTGKTQLENGSAIFQKNCAACHGKLGEGGVGPNLTDNYWLHGGDIKSMFKTIKYGVPAKGMIPWQAQLSPSQMQEVASYIKTLKGTNPPNRKAPQGDVFNK